MGNVFRIGTQIALGIFALAFGKELLNNASNDLKRLTSANRS